ncbi:hypothetical protein TNCV_4640581 [Trichonephila clavipes]|nr:hypothetical protein TNCV_4640581 [Trichonephila clavipes]
MPPVSQSQIEAHENHRGNGLDVRLSLALALSTIQRTMTLNTFSATIGKGCDLRDVSCRNGFSSSSRLQGKINVDQSSSRNNAGLATETSPTPHASTGLDS